MILFGDIHNHCGMTYGFGGLDNALKNASTHLDFCAVTGHAFWPDIPMLTPETEFLVKFHNDGFNKLKKDYLKNIEIIDKNNIEGKFTTFLSYEMHSAKYGDHHIVSGNMKLPLITNVCSPKELFNALKTYEDDTIIIPHHIAYTPGVRGINWKEYDCNLFPLVEVISKHGCSISDKHPNPYYHTMGGRDGRNTVYEGLKSGKRFGFIGSTDHHAGYPGSYGDGCVAVDVEENTRSSIINALKERRVYALSGDKILCDFRVNGHKFGGIIKENNNSKIIEYSVELSYFLDKLVILKNQKPIKIINGEELVSINEKGEYKIRIEFGWGSNNELDTWNFIVTTNGKFSRLEKCFRGRSVLAPSEGVTLGDWVNIIDNRVEMNEKKIMGRVQTVKNETTTSPSTCGIVATVFGDLDTVININVNGIDNHFSIRELLANSYTFQSGITNGKGYKVHLCVPESQYKLTGTIEDNCNEPCEYHMEIFQKNGSMAFVSPVYFE